MRLRRRSGEEPSVNLTPLIDVVFLLLIFFMVSTTFEREAEIKIELPEASAKKQEQPERAIVEVLIDSRGRYFVNGQELINTQLETLKRAMRKAAPGGESPQVLLSADRSTPFQAVVTAMDAAGQLGFVQVAISTREGGE